ncbi:CheA signal transduction histidine kinase [Desulfarculus baarsii DSM 2075]|uniref:Chemotaxis protein CheA n=1 Tax=Desulfarculus baarsii (strain ATCC 33931 / DSM 2075 / LMG 7858 / VKM B-1802 / 2st14) TaxID=644282 RepID=E1QM93_DESB2|nr:chemotaxis protein CheA [Desulfarculus baarsii]ADK86136.1 CheA signal transduction histidine kinase [Desulfarculus baarsii DSM 2075]
MSGHNEVIGSLLDEMASEVMILEAGDLMAYGEFLSHLERLEIVCEGGGDSALTRLVGALKAHMEGMILGEVADQEGGLELARQGVSVAQGLLRGEAADAEVGAYMASPCLAARARSADAPPVAAPPAAAPPAPAQPEEAGLGEPPDLADDDIEFLPDAPDLGPTAEPEPQLINDEDMELLTGFVNEALEHLESIEVNALVLEDSPQDVEALNAVFRPFHTIKGVSGFLNLTDINHLAHALENLLDKARAMELVVDSVAIDVILGGVDFLRQMIEESLAAANERRARRAFDTSELEARVEALLSGQAPAPAPAAAPAPEPEPVEPLKLGEVLVGKRVVSPEDMDEALETQRQKKPDKHLGEILVAQGKAQPDQVAEGLRAQKAMTQGAQVMAAQEVKIDTQKLDNLLDMVGELVIAQSMVQANPHVQAISDRKLHTDLGQLARITTELQKSTMSMRMIPIRQTFQKMVRVVRDTAKKRGKKVRLELVNEDTEIDRNMVEKFYDPLMHMVRNSVDHGIEDPEERQKIGKPEEGAVRLSAYHKGGSVCIEIADDGRGLDRDKIARKAVERGLIASDDDMTDQEVYALIMRAGFSTAEQITDISGRGVGMDVVQRTIDELRGKIEIQSTLGEGTILTIALPLTLAIIDGMVVKVGPERFILPTISVAESLRPARADYTTVQGKGEMIIIRGNLLPLVRLHEIVGIEPDHRQPWEGLVVVVEHHGHRRCLMVDQLVGRQEVVIKSLGESLKDVKVAAGGAIMGDGRVSLILDVEGVFKSHEGRRA